MIIQTIFIIIFFLFSIQNLKADEIIFVNDLAPYCPYTNCGNNRSGFVIDTVRAIFESKGYKVKIVDVPWSRALIMVKNGKADGILGLVKGSSPELIYPKIEIARYENAIFTLKSNPWKYNGIDTLKNVRLALIQGYYYEVISPELKNFIKDPKNKPNIYWTNSLSRSLLMIERKRLDAVMEDKNVVQNVIYSEKMSDNIKYSGSINSRDNLGFVGFSRENSKSQMYADIFDEGMIKLRKSNQFKKILDKYNVKDWK